jgi:hypothetical protein
MRMQDLRAHANQLEREVRWKVRVRARTNAFDALVLDMPASDEPLNYPIRPGVSHRILRISSVVWGDCITLE